MKLKQILAYILRAISCHAYKLPVRKDAHWKPTLPNLTGSWSYAVVFCCSFTFYWKRNT